MNQIVWNATAISDDLMGHWLQRLDGRRLVVILDTCHAGGWATNEKGISFPPSARAADDDPLAAMNHLADGLALHRVAPARVPVGMDFLDGEVVRLKDIGQRNLALIASSSASESSLGRRDTFPRGRGPFGVFGSYVIDAWYSAASPLSVEDVYAHARDGMKEFFRQNPLATVHEPYLFNDLTDPVYLKP